MSLLTRSWVTSGRVARAVRQRLDRRGPTPSSSRWDLRYRWIEQHAGGRSFLDVGGLFQVAGDVAFAAEAAGATEVALLDAGDVELTEFPAKAAARGSGVRVHQGDLEDPDVIRAVGPHDVVWCTGVLYHSASPLLQLLHLRALTRELLVLGTHTIPEVPGLPQACVFYPWAPPQLGHALSAAHQGRTAPALGLDVDDRPMHGFANFWWGITPSALRAMLRAARFEVVEELPIPERPFMVDVVARPIDKAPMLPPTSYYRERREAIARGEALPFDTFYEETGRGYV